MKLSTGDLVQLPDPLSPIYVVTASAPFLMPTCNSREEVEKVKTVYIGDTVVLNGARRTVSERLSDTGGLCLRG